MAKSRAIWHVAMDGRLAIQGGNAQHQVVRVMAAAHNGSTGQVAFGDRPLTTSESVVSFASRASVPGPNPVPDAFDQVTRVLVAGSPLNLGLADPRDEGAILAAVELGNRSRSTLGHMPMAVYREAAQRRCLVLARDGDTVIAYALYALTTRRIRRRALVVIATSS